MVIDNQIIEENRTFYDSIGNIYAPDTSVTISKEIIANIPCYWFQPQNPKPNELIIYVHGGGYAIGSIQSHKAMVSHFAKGLNRSILFVEYALAPEKPYPNGLNDVLEIYAWVGRQFPQNEFYLFGDSAGGGLIIKAIHEITQRKLKALKAVALISPWYNLATNYPSADNRQQLDQILTKELVKNFAYAYAGNNVVSANPSQLRFEHFPPVFTAVGTNEILFDDSIHFFDMVYKIQPQSQLKIYGGQGHVLTQLDIFSPSSQDLIANIYQFFNNAINE